MRKISDGLKSRGVPAAWLLVVIVSCFLASILPSGAAEKRQWQDDTGKFQVTASFKEVNDAGEVVLEMEDGSTRNVPLKRLSKKDRDYVAKTAPVSAEAEVETPEETQNASSGKAPKMKSESGEELTDDEKWDKWGWKAAAGGLILVALGSLIAVVDAFCVSVIWGLASLLLPLVNLVYIATHWHRPTAARGGMLLFLGLAISIGTVLALKQTERVREMLKEHIEIPGNPFGKAEDGESG